ncbi:alpha/beta fold hydrolase [Xenorhabdus bovienii]|nr:alpha/beta fold hydrolase [Xenorhabdus bovienii]MDE9497926.1 alpha/beta fold hydrolase [Xenorhabdus bovienii]
MYRPWLDHFPPQWNIVFIDYPGRGMREDEQALDDIPSLADYLLPIVRTKLGNDSPFVFFGHSMGALVAYQLIQRLMERGERLPLWLGVSGRAEPGFVSLQKRHLLPDPLLQQEITRFGGIPASLERYPELWQQLLPLFRHDLAAIENWRDSPAHYLLPIPVSTFSAWHDPVVAPDQVKDWQKVCLNPITCHVFNGDHFYFLGQESLLVTSVVADINAILLSEDESCVQNGSITHEEINHGYRDRT